jgi:hypothetical protein
MAVASGPVTHSIHTPSIRNPSSGHAPVICVEIEKASNAR